MVISVEVSYYSLKNNYIKPVEEFLGLLDQTKINYKVQIMSTLLFGEYNEIFDFLNNSFKLLLKKYPSVFILKISNSCYKED